MAESNRKFLVKLFDKEGLLAAKLVEYPLLRMLLFTFWFRLAFIAFILFGITLALFPAKIWRSSPAGFMPVIKISGLDMAQAWQLKRSARNAMAAGKMDEALFAWQGAQLNNMADPETFRGLLRCLIQHDSARAQLLMAAREISWLLRLTSTNNIADVELSAQAYEKYRLHDFVVSLLRPLESRLTPDLEAAYLRALFHTRQMNQFSRRWKQAGAKITAQPTMQLYHAAYQAGWGMIGTMTEGQQQLDQAQGDTAHRILAHQLQLAVSLQKADPVRYGQSLQFLSDWRGDTVLDHVYYWRLLLAYGQKTRAAQLAKWYPYQPTTATETTALAEVYADLDLKPLAREFMKNYAQKFGYMESVWLVYANLLIDDQQWGDLLALALQIRQSGALQETLVGFSHFLEGRAELELNRVPRAEAAFKRIVEHSFTIPTLGLSVAAELIKLKYPQIAEKVLAQLRQPLAKHLPYWQLVFNVAIELKRADLMLAAAQAAFQLMPAEWVFKNNYAGALITLRQRPEEAVRLTLQLVNQQPNSVITKINHSLALLQNQRTREAEILLRGIDPRRLRPDEMTAYYLGLIEMHYNLKEYDQVRDIVGRIDRKGLFPTELQWLDNVKKQVEKKNES